MAKKAKDAPLATALVVYGLPAESEAILTLDSGHGARARTTHANGRDDAHVLVLPGATAAQGAIVELIAPGCAAKLVRGILTPVPGGSAVFTFDDFGTLGPDVIPPSPTPAPPDPAADPQAIVRDVYESGSFDLSTKEGCGRFTEAVCDALRARQSLWWGHIAKDAAQNQWHGHAIDAVQLLAPAGPTDPGIYDIIWSTESPEAKPAWSYKGEPEPHLCYYPA